MNKLFITLLFLSLIIVCKLKIVNCKFWHVYAQRFDSDSYIIEMGNFNMTGGRKSSDSFNLTDTVGENAPGQSDGSTYVLKSGFQYIHDTLSQFSFAIDDLNIDFGNLVPESPISQSNTITINSPIGQGYQILAHQNHSLKNIAGVTIPDTSCDSSTCSESTEGLWTQTTTYGFGLNAIGLQSSTPTGIGTSQYFPTSSHFRQFANIELGETPQIIMSETLPAKDRSAQITYKVNISSLQASGNYQNAITFTAIPNY